jgi:hypothetical protein
MDIDTCIEAYLKLSSAAFQPKRTKGNIFAKAIDFLKADGKYSSNCLASEIKAIVESREGDPQAKLMNANAPCKT